ncbi:MAG TPA: DNA polymerase IV [Anaerolineae bacterium]|nr:DNA polymerase IV [Anaerolineae bacterium]
MTDSPRSILHIDLDAFFVSVELLDRPDLRGRPVVVGGRPEERGVVSSASYEARAFGVRSAMPMRTALQKCPDLIILPARHGVYAEWSHKVMTLLYEITPQVEPMSIDEAYLDVTGAELLWGTPEQIARTLKARIRAQFNLPCSIGAASNKLVAKIAAERAKPDGICVVPPGEEAAFLAPLPVERLWGAGPKTSAALRGLGLETIGELAAASPASLARKFGARQAGDLIRRARGLDESPVVVEREARQISQEVTFARDIADRERLRRVLLELSEGVGARLRAGGVDARTVALKLRYADFTTLTRQTTLPEPTHLDQPIYDAAWRLFQKTWTRRPVRLLGIAARNLGQPARQLSLFEPQRDRRERLTETVDQIRARYGDDAIKRTSLVRKRVK